MLQTLRERWGAARPPVGYRAGATLEKARRNLGLLDYTGTAPDQAMARLSCGGPLLQVCERTEAQWLMHLVMCQWHWQGPALNQGDAYYALHHSGALRRQGLRWQPGAPAWLLALVSAPGPLNTALMALDFKTCTLACRAGQWALSIEHMGASEVVNRMPAFRRYIAISPAQCAHLATVFAVFSVALLGT